MQLDSTPKRHSPIHNRHQASNASLDLREGWLIPEVYTTVAEEVTVLRECVGLADISARGKLNLKGDNTSAVITACFGDTPTKPGEVIEFKSKDILIAELTPDEFLSIASPGAEKEMATSLQAEIESQGAFVSVIDQTSGLVGLSISGPKSTAVMSKLCAIPFNSKGLPILCVVQSSFANVRAMIIRHEGGISHAFELFTDRSYGDYLWNTILDAGMEYGIKPVGWEAIRELNRS